MPRKLINIIIAIGTLLAVGAQATAGRIYMPVDLETLGGAQSVALGMNDRGMVVGWSETAQPIAEVHAFLWMNDRMEDLDTLGGAWSEGRAINDSGVVVGSSETADGRRHGFVWYDGVMHNLTDILRVPPPEKSDFGEPDACYSQIEVFVEANDINEHGWIVGCAYMEADPQLHGILAIPFFVGPPPAVDPAYFYIDLGRLEEGEDCLAMGVSDTAMVVGISGNGAFRWVDEVIEPLEPFATLSFAADVDAAGTVVGWTADANVDDARTACMWFEGTRRDLGFFPGGITSANAINETGLIVGFAAEGPDAPAEAVLWEGCIPYNLNDITVVPVRTVLAPWQRLTEATDIDALGRIVGYGTSTDGVKRAVLLFDPTDFDTE
jgi:probable HAF family extracellular repeat protein